MNKIFRTVWNHHRRQIVVVNENTTSHSQAKGSTETSSVETFVAKAKKTLGLSLLAAAVSSYFALPAQASWITDNGGKNGTLDWTVGTAGTTTWKTIKEQDIEILKGETLNVLSIGSFFNESATNTLPNLMSFSKVVNRGNLNFNWKSSEKSVAVENEGNYLDNYGKFKLVYDLTPIVNAGTTVPSVGKAIHNLNGWEIYQPTGSAGSGDGKWALGNIAFYNRKGATFDIDIDVDTSKLTADLDESLYYSSVVGFHMETVRDVEITGKNAGTMTINLENPAYRARSVLLNDKSIFINESTGVMDLKTTYAPPPGENFAVNNNAFSAGIDIGGSKSKFQNDGKMTMTIEGPRAFAIYSGSDSGAASFINSKTGLVNANIVATGHGKTALEGGNAVQHVEVLGVGVNDSIENYGTFIGKATGNGVVAKGIGLNKASSHVNNYAGATLELTAKSVATAESINKAQAVGAYLNGGEQFINNGKATLKAIVDGAGTEKVAKGWAIDARDAGTLVSNTETLNLNYTGATGGGIHLTNGAAFENSKATTITVTRPKDETVRTSLKGIYLDKTSQVTNAGNIKIAMNGTAPNASANSFRNQGGDMTGIAVLGNDESVLSLLNKKGATIAIDMTIGNSAKDQTNGIRGYGMSIASNTRNEGTIDATVTANYGQVSADFEPFSAVGFNIDGENATNEPNLPKPRIENTGVMKADVTYTAQGMTPSISPSKARGWAMGFNMHGTSTFVNDGTLEARSHSTVLAKGASVQGSDFINNKDAVFEAEATGDGSFAAALQVGRPNGEMVEVPSYVLNDINGTLTLTASAPKGGAHGIYHSAGKIENKGTIIVSATGKNVNGVHLASLDLERTTAVNPEFLNLGNLTITAKALEAMPTVAHSANGILLESGTLTNKRTITANVSADGYARGVRVFNSRLVNEKGGRIDLVAKSGDKIYSDGVAEGIWVGKNATVENAGELNIELDSRVHFVKGIGFEDGSSVLKNTGSITITGTSHGDGSFVADSTVIDQSADAYGMYLNTNESFANDGKVSIAVDSLKEGAKAIRLQQGKFTNNASGVVDMTVQAHEKAAYGIDLDGANGSANNAGTITMDVTGGTTEKGNAYGLHASAKSYVANTGNMTFNLHGVTSAASNAEVGAIVTTGQGTKFKNSGRIDITGRRTGDIVTSGDVLGIRVADKGVFDNAEAGVITIDLGPTGNKQAANYYAVQVLDGSTFGNAGTVNITLDHEADNLGAVHGLLLASDAVVNNTATGSIKIDVSPEDVGLSDVLAINGQEATIRNYGTIETNGAVQVGSIVGSSASLDGGTVKFTGKDAVSTVTTELKTGTLENAGTLTVGAKDLPNWAVNVYDLKNTGTLNAGTLIALNSIDNTGVLNLDTTQRIAIGLYGKDAASSEHVTLVNRESGQLSINVDADSALLIQTGHVAGIDLFSPTNAPDLTGGDFTNFGTTNITVKSERGTNYGIVADSTHESTIRNDGTLTIDVTQTAADATYGVSGIRGNHNTTLVNNGTLSIEGATAGGGYLQGVVLYGSETSRGSFRNDGTTSITLSANDGLDPATATNAGAIGLHLSYGDGVNTGDMTLDIAGLRTDAIKLENGSTFTNSGSITVNSKASEGNDQAIFVISGSTFTNTESGHFTYNYINEDPLLKTASSDGLSTTGGSSSVNQGTIDIHLKDLAQRETGKFMKGFYVGDKATFTNSGVINLTSETQGSVEAIDGAVAVNGVFENLGDVTLDVTSHGSDRQVWVGVGTLNNKKNLTVTALNDGNGDVVGFMHDWKFTTPDVQTLHVSNEKDMTLTLTANAGDAMVFDMQGQERFDNAEGGVVTANVSGGTSAKGFVLGDTTIFANDGTLNLTLMGLTKDSALAGLEALSDGMTATNSGELTITLAGNGKTAAGLKSAQAGARFANNAALAINATGTFDKVTGIDWAGEVANAGTIATNAGLNIGSVTGAGSLTVTGGDVRVGSLTDQQSVTLRNVGSAAFDTISMKSGTLSIESGKTTAKVTGTSTLKHLTNAGNLTLGGTLTLGASGAQGSLTNTGTLTMGDAHVVGSVLNSGTFTSGDMDVAGSVHNTRTGVMQTGTLTVRGDRALTNEGEMTVADTSSVFGTLTNTGTIYLYDKSLVGEDGQIENKDELLVYGTLEVNGLLINLGTSKAEELILNGESVSGVQSAFFSMDRANEGAESIVQSGEINAKRTNYGKDYWGTVTVNAVYENHDLVFAGSSDTVLDQSGQALAGSGMTIAAGGSILNQSGATLRVNGALDNSGTISGGTLALDAGGQFTNRKNVNVDKLTGSNLTFTQGEAGASFETTKNEVTNSQFVWTQGSISLDALGKGNRYELGGHVGDSVTVDLDLLTSDSTVNIGQGAELAVGTISLDGTESTVTLAGGTLKTSLDQIFSDVEVNGAVDIDAESSKDTVNVAGITVATGVGGIKDAVSKGIAFNSGTVAFTDRVFALDVAGDVLAKLEADDNGTLEVAFNGKAAGVDAFTVDVANKVVATKPEGGSTYAVFTGETLVNKDAEEPGLGYTQLVVGDIDPRGRYTPNKNTHRVEQSMGFKNVTGVTGGLYINDARFVLVGDKDQAIDLADGLVQVIGGSMSGDGLTLGSYGSEAATKGHLAELNLGVFAEDGGYRVAGGATDVHNGDFTVDALRLGGTLTVGDKDRDDKGNAKLTIGNLTAYAGELVNHGNTHIGTVASGDDKPVIKLENYGSMTIDNGLVEGRLLNKEGGTLTTGNLTLGYTDSLNNGTWTAESLTIAGAKQYVGDLISRGELYNASTLNVANGLTLESTALTQPEATGGVLTNRSTIRSKPAALTVGGTFTMKEKSSFTSEGKYALFTADAMEMAQGSTVTNRVDGAITIKNHANIAGNWTNEKGTSTFGSLTVTNTGAMVNNGTLAVTGKTELAGSVTGTGNATLDDLTIDPTGVLAMTGAGALTAGDVVVNAGGKMSVAGASTLGSLTATNAGELAFGTLSMTGDLNLTGSVMTALLSQAGNVTLSGSQLTSQRDATLASLTMTGSEAAFGNTTVAGDVSVTGGVLTTGNLTGQNLTVRDQASVNGKTAHVASLDAKDGTIVLDAITSDGTILLDNTTLKGHVVSGADMIVTNAGAVTSTGATTLDSLTMTNAEESSFGELTVNGNVSLTGTKLTANLVKGGDTTLSASDITSEGTSELASLAMTNGSNAVFGTLTIGGTFDVNGSILSANIAEAGIATVTNGGKVTSTGKTTLASLTMTDAQESSFGDLTVTGDVNLTNTKLTANLASGEDVDLTGSTLVSTGVSNLTTLSLAEGSDAQFGSVNVAGNLDVNASVLKGELTQAGATTVGANGQILSSGPTTLASLTMTDAKDSTFGDLTVTSDVSLTNTKLTANLKKGGNTTLTGSALTSKGASVLDVLSLAEGSSGTFGTLMVNGAIDVDASILHGAIAKGGAATVTNGGEIQSTGKTELASLTMTDAKDSAFDELTVTGDVLLTNTTLDADLRNAGNTTLANATLTSTGNTTLAAYTQTNGAASFGHLNAKTVDVTEGAFATAGLTAEEAAFKGAGSQVTLNGLTTVGTFTATGTNVKMSDLVITDALTNDSTLTGKTFKAQGADGKAVSVTNTGTIRFDGASGSVAYSQTAGALEVAKNGFTDSTFDVKGGTVKTNGLGKGNAWTLGGVKDASVLMTLDRLTSEGSVSINEGATLETSLITLDGKTETVVLAGGTLATMMDQIFDDVKMNQGIDIGAGKPGDIVDVEGLNAVVGVGDIKDEVSTGIGFNAGTVAFNDKVYSLTLAADVLGKLEADDGGDLEVVFNGRANVNQFTVDVANGIEATQGGKPAHAVFAGETLINADKTQPDLQYTKLVVGSAEPAIADAHNLTQSMGFMNVTGVTDGLFIRGEDTEFVLVGVDEKAQGVGDIHSFMLADGVVDVGEGAAFTLGSYGKALGTEGKLTAITNNGTVNVKNGLFTVETLTGNGTVAVSDKDHAKVAATLKVTTLEQNDVSNFGTIEAETATIGTLANTGTLNAKTLALTGVASTNVGTIHAEIARLGESVNLTNTGSWTGNALDVDGTFVHNGKTLDVATATIDGTLTNAGAADIDALTINGHVDQTGSLTAKGVTVADNADIVNNGSLTTDTLTLKGAYAGKGGLTVNVKTDLTGSLVSTADGIKLGDLTVTDGDLTALNLTTGNATVTGKSTVAVDNWTGKTLTLEGTTTVAETLKADKLDLAGALTAGAVEVATINTAGSFYAGRVDGTAFNLTAGTSRVDGLMEVITLKQTGGELIAQNVHATDANLAGKAQVGSLTSDTLTVSGTLEADEVTTSTYDQTAGSADIGTLTSTTLANAGDMTVGTMDAALANTGTLTIKTGFALTGSNAGTITAEASKGTLTDFTNNGTASFGKTTATGLANNGTITFADATLEGANNNTKDMSADILNVKGSLTTTGTLTASNTTVTGTLSVNGGKTSLDALNLKGTLGTKGELTARKAEITGSFNLTSGKTTIGNATVNKGHVNVAGGSFHADAYTQKGGSLTLAQGGSFTSGNLIVSGSDITLGDAALNAEGSIKDSNITITAGNWADNLLGLTNTDKGALGDNDFTLTGGVLDLGDKTLTSSGTVTMTGGTLVADKIALDGKTQGTITVGGTGTLQTSFDQIFHDFVVEGVEITATNWEEGWGAVHGQVIEAATDVGDIKSSITTGIKFEGGSLSFTDEAFRTDLVAEVGSALAEAFGNGKVNVEFLGHAVDDFTLDTIHKLEEDGMADKTQGLVFAGDDLINNSGDKTLDVGKSDTDDIHMNTGFSGVTDTDHINIKDGLEFVLVGKTDKDGKPSGDKLLSDAENGGSVHVNTGTLTLGSNGVKDKTGGTLAEVVLDEQGNLVIKNGDFTVERIESDGTLHVTGGGSLTSNDVTLDKGDSKIDEGGVLVVEDGESNGNLHIKGDGALTNEGTLIAGGKNSHVDSLVDGDLVNKGTGLYDDMDITNGGHYHNTETGKDAGDRIDVAEGGKWTNDGLSDWGSVNIDGQFENNGGIEIGDGNDATDDFHVGPEGSVDQNGQLDASNAGHAQIDGSFTTGELTPEGKPDDNAWSKFDDVTVGNGGHLENNGTELGNGLVVDQGGEYVNNGHSNWGSVDIAGNGDNNGDLTIRGDGKDDTPDFIVEGSGSMTNDGTLIAGGEDTKNDTLVEGDLVNKGTGLYDDMTITNGGHYHNTSTGKDQGDKIDVAEGGKWTNDGQSSWGQVDINGGATNNGDLIIGNGNDKDDDFHIGPDGSLENNGHIDAGNSGTADIEGDLINGSLTPEGKPDEDATIKFEDAVVHPGGKLENNGTEEGDSLVVENDGEYINNGNSNWNDVTINEGGHGSNNGKLDVEDDLVIDGIFDNDGTINAGNTVIGGDFNQTDDGVLNTGDLTVRPGGDIDMDKGEINVSGDLNLNGANVVIGNWKALSPDNRVSPTWSAEKPLDGKLWVIGNGDLTFGTASDGFADKIQKFDEKVPGLTGAAARVTVGQTVTMGKGSSLAVGSNVWNPAKDEGRVEMKEGSVYFGRDSYVLIDIGSLGDAPAFATTVEGATATVEHGASLVFGNLTKTGEFTLLEGFDLSANLGEDGDWKGGWDGEDLYIVNDDGSGLDYFIQLDVDKDGNKVSANVDVADLETVYPDIVLPGLGNEALQDCAKGNDSSFICGIVKDENLTVEEKTRIINSVAQIASVGGTTASAYADMGLVSDVLEDRLSFTGPTHKDGQLLQIPATDALWVEVIGGKTKTGSLALSNLSGGVKSDTYGVMIGADALMPKPAVKVGGAFSYLSGSLTSTGSGLSTTNDYDTYGAHLYAAWTSTTKFNLVGHVDWMLQDSDISMSIGTDSFGKASAKPNVNVAQAGIRAEVRETVGVFDIVPHVGLRAVYTKTDDFKTKIDGKNAFRNALEDTFTVQMPIGLTVSGYVPAQGGWTVAPKADITFVPQLGDTDQTSTVRGTAMSSSDSVNGAFAGEYYGQVKLGLTMINPKADTSFGGTVGYARGDAGKKDLTFGVQFTKNF